MVKCWDLETNKVVRHYHGHLSGVYTLSLHPTLDVLCTGGRDGVVRVWDMRTRSKSTSSQATKPQSPPSSPRPRTRKSSPPLLTVRIRMYDLAAGKPMGVLTHHKKGVRSLATHPTEYTFASASASPGQIKQWLCPEGQFMQNLEGHNSVINSLSVNEDNVLFSGGDNRSIAFWDGKTGHRYQYEDSVAQPGSLDAEAGIMSSMFDLTGLRLVTGEADRRLKCGSRMRMRQRRVIRWSGGRRWGGRSSRVVPVGSAGVRRCGIEVPVPRWVQDLWRQSCNAASGHVALPSYVLLALVAQMPLLAFRIRKIGRPSHLTGGGPLSSV